MPQTTASADRTIVLGGTRAHLRTEDEVRAQVRARLRGGGDVPPLCVASLNLDHIHHFGPRARPGSVPAGGFADSGAGSWLVLLDGAPPARRARRLTGRDWPRLTGADLLGPLLADAEEIGAPVGFLGGGTDMHTRLLGRLAHTHPRLTVAGCWAPERAEVTDAGCAGELADRVRESGAALLVVGLGKPRQERWMADHAVRSGAAVLLGFGAAADFAAGDVPRAPVWMRRAGIEWSYRLAREPRRLFRRYCVQGPAALHALRRHSRVAGGP